MAIFVTFLLFSQFSIVIMPLNATNICCKEASELSWFIETASRSPSIQNILFAKTLEKNHSKWIFTLVHFNQAQEHALLFSNNLMNSNMPYLQKGTSEKTSLVIEKLTPINASSTKLLLTKKYYKFAKKVLTLQPNLSINKHPVNYLYFDKVSDTSELISLNNVTS